MMTIQKLKTLYLGRQGESNITIINVDVSSWLTEYPNGTITLMLMRPTEKAAYPVVGTVTNNIFSYKSITNGETWTTEAWLGKLDSINNWHDTNDEPPEQD